MNEKNTWKLQEVFAAFILTIYLVAIMLRVGMSFPFVFMEKSSLHFENMGGWIRVFQEKGEGSSFVIQFTTNKDFKLNVNLVCADDSSNSVSSSKCGVSEKLLKTIIRSNKSDWQPATINAAHLNFWFFGLSSKKQYLAEKIELNQ